ncbi:LL-diaminopimelate aminotransferase [Estrella lausannensis]|uniref:LL-diaminopimelate aminotransferase n=1 Tax=Estrella lausannensis TaxID=483423 RepID=A0A0H5DS14_9BACT|nr:LL-diaminopimelate aminotransferase [Estrella lausannensis]CRX39447.1 L,L-diaminopimelate aminotransferase [Estrella lausannensis]
MVKANPHLKNLKGSYLFPEIEKRKRLFLESNPGKSLISLGIGDTTTPLPRSIVEAISAASEEMGQEKGYSGYGPSFGLQELRQKIAQVIYKGVVKPDEIIISDGCKPDIARVLMLFNKQAKIGIQDPAYPVYVDASVITGQGGPFDEGKGIYSQLHYIPCPEKNGFVPDIDSCPPLDVITIISPNNPTGVVYTKEELKRVVDFAKKHKSVILFDAAYSSYIQGESLPRSIFEIEGAKEVAIELNSFSKMAGFSGLRLGWTVVPSELHYEDGTAVKKDFERIISTCFNGASIITQKGGIAALSEKGMQELALIRKGYLENAALLKKGLESLHFHCYGGDHAPYVFARKDGGKSWELFDKFLNQGGLITTPGSGFGPSGEGYLRFSAFAKHDEIIEAVSRLKSIV